MKTYKALMYSGKFIESIDLRKGLYEAITPCLYSNDTTIEELSNNCDDLLGVANFTPTQIQDMKDNLSKCQLVEVVILEKSLVNKMAATS